VDSIGWVRDDSIVVGCLRVDEEGNEVGYLVQVIRSGGDTFFEVNCPCSVCISCFDSNFIL
jgi:nuclear pore complex protein Nup214